MSPGVSVQMSRLSTHKFILTSHGNAQRAAPWENRRSWSLGNCAGAGVPSPAGASAEDLGSESAAAQRGGGCAGVSTTGEGSLLLWEPSLGSFWEMSCSSAAATAGLMSWLGWASEEGGPGGGGGGGGPGGEGGRRSEGGGAWWSTGCFLFDNEASEDTKRRENLKLSRSEMRLCADTNGSE